jgi:tetratricopeptide (TPR) repeat protein
VAVLHSDIVFLRGRDGAPVGPVPVRDIEVLFTTRVIDKATPISEDGESFQPLSDHPELLARIRSVEQDLMEGRDPWPADDAPIPLPLDALQMHVELPFDEAIDLSQTPPLWALFRCAVFEARGLLELIAGHVRIEIAYLDGKVATLSTDTPELSLASHLIDQGLVTDEQITDATVASDSLGGDLGAGLISLGLIQPHIYLERYAAWSKQLLGTAASWSSGIASFIPAEVSAPVVPLGLERFGVVAEALKQIPKTTLELVLASERDRLLIPAQLEGASLEEMKLPARELRVIKSIDGTKTLNEVLETNVGQDQGLAALRGVYFARAVGMAVLGEDQFAPKERAEAAQLELKYEELKDKGPLEIFGVKATASDEEVHGKYMQLAKEYHPDRARSNAVPELHDVRKRLFALVQNAYEAAETEELRLALQEKAAYGISADDERRIVQAALEAETLFAKAGVLAKMRKFHEALEHIEDALKRKPDDAEFKIHRAYFRYMSEKQSETTYKNAVTEIQAILKADANIASGYLFLARLHKSQHQNELAVKQYKKLLEYDEKNHEAQSEIRLFNIRREKEKEKKKWL